MALQSPSSPTATTSPVAFPGSTSTSPCPTPPDAKPAPLITKDMNMASSTNTNLAGQPRGKPRPISKQTQRSKTDNFAEKLEKMLTPEGIAEYQSQAKDRDDSTIVSETASLPGFKKRGQEDKREGKAKKAGVQKGPEKETKVNRFLERLRAGGTHQRNFKEYESLIEAQEKEKLRLQKENETLREVAMIAQQTSLINESRFQEEIRSLEYKLEAAVLARLNDSEKMNALRLYNRKIQDEIANMRGIAERQAQVEKENLIRAFTKQIELKAAELDDERRNGRNTTGEWILKNQELQDQMDQMLNATEAKHVTNRALMEQNKILTVEYKAQADDQKFLSKELDVAKRRNTSLKDRIHELEAQMTEVQKPVSEGKKSGSREKADIETGFLSSLKDAKSANLSETEKQSKFEEALERVKKLSEIERRNLDQVRAAHLHTLSMRTELEVLLRESITEVQNDLLSQRNLGISKEPPPPKGPVNDVSGDESPTAGAAPAAPKSEQVSLSEFAAADRRRVIEIMLSRERVLRLLYTEDRGAFSNANPANQAASLLFGGFVAPMAAQAATTGGAAAEGPDADAAWHKWHSMSEADGEAKAASAELA